MARPRRSARQAAIKATNVPKDAPKMSSSSSSSSTPMKPFPLMRLPLEVRNMIYRRVMLPTDNAPYDLVLKVPVKPTVRTSMFTMLKQMQPHVKPQIEILQTCRTIHREALAVIYSQTEFVIVAGVENTPIIKAMNKFLRQYTPFRVLVLGLNSAVRAHAHLITRIRVEFLGTGTSGTEELYKCKNLRTLKIGTSEAFYEAARGTGDRSLGIEDVSIIRDLLLVRGLTRLEIQHRFNLKVRKDLKATQVKTDALLRKNLVKKRLGSGNLM